MSITPVTTEDLRRMWNQDGLIIQGCGGDLNEWVDGINELLEQTGILRNGSKFESVMTFQHGETTCLLFPFEGVDADIGKLALWRLDTVAEFGGIWLSDYVNNRLGGFLSTEPEKPDCPLIGQDGNIFNLVGIAARTLRQNDMPEQAKAMTERVFTSGSYNEALCIIGEYVNITSAEEMRERRSSVRQALQANAELQKQIVNYAKTRAVYVEYRKAGYSQKFRAEHESDILIHQAAKKHFDDVGIEKLPSMKTLRENYAELLAEKRKVYAGYKQARSDMRELYNIRANVESLLELSPQQKAEKETQKSRA